MAHALLMEVVIYKKNPYFKKEKEKKINKEMEKKRKEYKRMNKF